MITLEAIDRVMAATGASYYRVREALLEADGDADAAINALRAEEAPEGESEDAAGEPSTDANAMLDDIVSSIKEIWRTGNASSLIIEKQGKQILNLSLTISALALLVAPLVVLLGLGAALVTEYTIKVIMKNGDVIDVREYTLNRRGLSQERTSANGE